MTQGWEIKKLSEIGKIFNGNSINEQVKKNKYTDLDQGFPFIATKDVGLDSAIDYENGVKIAFAEKNQFKIAPPNTSLICAEGGSAGRKIGFTNQDVCFGNKLFALVPNKNIDSKFIFYFYFTSSFQKNFSTEMAGIIGGVSMNKFKDIEIPIPPLHEQQCIVAILDEAFIAIAKTKSNIEQNLKNAKELFLCYLQMVFENNSDGWEDTKLANLCSSDRIITYGVIKLGDEVDGGIPCLRTSNVRWLRIDLTGMKRISSKLSKEYSRTILKGGEILVNVRGTLGGVAVVPKTMNGWNVSREVAVVPVDYKKVNPSFISYLIGSVSTQKWLGGVKKGAAYVGINIEDLRQLPISFPQMKEQQIIVQKLDSLSFKIKKLEAIYKTKLNDLEELKKAILQKAFSGELTKTEVIV